MKKIKPPPPTSAEPHEANVPVRNASARAHELTPHEIIRKSVAHLYFGLRSTQLDEKIESGEIPTPIKLSKSGRGRGFLGSQILDWQAQKLAEATKQQAQKLAEATKQN